MSTSRSREEVDTMPPKAMSQEALKKMFEEIFEAKVKEMEKVKDKGKKG